MKVPEVRIASYCSFCAPQKKVETECVCCICGDDVCQEHASTLGVWNEKFVEKLRTTGHKVMPNLLTLRLAMICPNCAREYTLFHAMRKVMAKRSGGMVDSNPGGSLS